ncbi:MAG: 3-hydroxyacyl-ACP dehydratase FabZ [Candidatus Omnitrophica bacterium]|nr:3-hydroxyacyl-ACP dehydratase FabZ [Candidatus Omnitrophota bacterium]
MDNLAKRDIADVLPHRPPFVFVDKIVHAEGKVVTTSKIFAKDEEYFKGHFPGNPIVPGVLLIESMAQTAGIAALNAIGEFEKSKGEAAMFYLSRVVDVKFKVPVLPDEEVMATAEVIMSFGNLVKVFVKSKVAGKIVAEGEMILSKVIR